MNEEQRFIFDLLRFKLTGAFLISGHAGCGKTFLAMELIRDFVKQKRTVKVLCPTHQAKSEFTDKLGAQLGVDYRTVSSHLGQYGITDEETGRLNFMRGEGREDEDIVLLVDEASMVSDYEAAQLLKSQNKSLVLFFGDYAQLRSVLRRQNQLFDQIPTMVLREQHRNGDHILELCNRARETIAYPHTSCRGIVCHYSEVGLTEAFLRRLDQTPDPRHCVYLAYRNRTVDRIRILAHHYLYGDQPFVVGQFVRLDENCSVGKNGTIVEIKRVNSEVMMVGEMLTRVYRLLLWNARDGVKVEQWMVDPPTQRQIKDHLETLYQTAALNFKRNERLWEAARREIEEIKNLLTFSSSPFVMTVHKSQSRTIPYVFVDTRDIHTGHDRQRLLYVAYSRASVELNTIAIGLEPMEEDSGGIWG